MAREIFTLVRKHGEKSFFAALGPETPLSEHRQFIKQFRVGKEHPHIAEVVRAVPAFRIKLKPSGKNRSMGPTVEQIKIKSLSPAKPVNGTTIAGRVRALFAGKSA